MSKGVHNIAFYVSPDPECSRTTQNSEISLAPSRGRILYAIYGNSTCVINHIVVTAIDKRYRNYYVSTLFSGVSVSFHCPSFPTTLGKPLRGPQSQPPSVHRHPYCHRRRTSSICR